MALGFKKLGYHVTVQPLQTKPRETVDPLIQPFLVRQQQPSDWELILAPLNVAPDPAKQTAYFCMWESTRIPDEAMHWLNTCRQVIVPSRWSADCFSAQGVIAPIAVCPLGVDTGVFSPSGRKRDRLNVIGTASGYWDGIQDRKATDIVVQAFRDAFPTEDDVELRIKTFPGDKAEIYEDERIRVTERRLTEGELVAWFRSLDVFVCASRGAGWEMMALQAMACGVPVIAPNHGGLSEFWSDRCGPAIRFKVVPAGGPYLGNQIQIEPESLTHMLSAFQTPTFRKALHDYSFNARVSAAPFAWTYANCQLERILIDCGMLPTKASPLRKLSPEERILRFYRGVKPMPKKPMPDTFRGYTLTNIPQGLGDTMVLTDLPRKAHRLGEQAHVWSGSQVFGPLMAFNPYYQPGPVDRMVAACELIDRYDCGNGHTFQRLQRAWGYEPDLKPKGCIEAPTKPKPGRVAIHLEPGFHANWQREHVHPRARQIYPQTRLAIQQFIKANPNLEFVEVGSAFSNLENVEDKTRAALDATIKLLATCEYFLGIMSGPMHLAAALDLKLIVIVNFPSPQRIYLPTLVDFGQVEGEWLYSQAVHLHQEGSGELVPLCTVRNMERAIQGEIYPFHSDRFLPLIHEKL